MSVAIANCSQETPIQIDVYAEQKKSVGTIEVPKALLQSKRKPAIDSDKHLVDRTLRGDTRAYDLLVMKYQSRIARLVSVYIQDFDSAKDVVQESFFRAYKALTNYRGDSQFYTWLYRIAVNTSYNYLKANRNWLTRVETMEDNSQAEHAESKSLDPERASHNDDLKRGIHHAVAKLPLELRTVLMLREVEGLSYEQISEVVGCELGTVKSRISRARERVTEKTRHLYEKD